ncbi:hypothetical protein ES703_68821 [subsurface metagenome]
MVGTLPSVVILPLRIINSVSGRTKLGCQLMRKPYFHSSSWSKPGAAAAYMKVVWGSMRTPGMGYAFSHPPPASGLSSSRHTLCPLLARYAANAEPLGPAPTMTKSYLSSLFIMISLKSWSTFVCWDNTSGFCLCQALEGNTKGLSMWWSRTSVRVVTMAPTKNVLSGCHRI